MGRTSVARRTVALTATTLLVVTGCGAPDTGSERGDEFVIGTLLPQTGNLSALGPPEMAGVDLAAQEINAAGGVFGNDVRVTHADSGDASSNIASQSVDRLISDDVDVIVGAASPSVTRNVLTQASDNDLLMFSPGNTSDELTTADKTGLFFSTSPPDVLQGKVLAEEIKSDGHKTLAILALEDSYGSGLASRVEQVFIDNGGTVVKKVAFDPAGDDFGTEVGHVKTANADAYLVIGFDEAAHIMPEMVRQGIGPKHKAIYFTDGNLSSKYKDSLPPDMLTGVQVSVPGAQSTQDFRDHLMAVTSGLTEFSYAAEAYDASILTALAAITSDSESGEELAAVMVDLTKGGEKCTTFAQCKGLLSANKDIDYDGVSGPVELDDKGDPTQATISIYTYRADNTYNTARPDKSVPGTIE